MSSDDEKTPLPLPPLPDFSLSPRVAPKAKVPESLPVPSRLGSVRPRPPMEKYSSDPELLSGESKPDSRRTFSDKSSDDDDSIKLIRLEPVRISTKIVPNEVAKVEKVTFSTYVIDDKDEDATSVDESPAPPRPSLNVKSGKYFTTSSAVLRTPPASATPDRGRMTRLYTTSGAVLAPPPLPVPVEVLEEANRSRSSSVASEDVEELMKVMEEEASSRHLTVVDESEPLHSNRREHTESDDAPPPPPEDDVVPTSIVLPPPALLPPAPLPVSGWKGKDIPPPPPDEEYVDPPALEYTVLSRSQLLGEVKTAPPSEVSTATTEVPPISLLTKSRSRSMKPPPPPDEDLVALCLEMQRSISTVRSKFSCMEAVRWLVLNGRAVSEADAVEKGEMLLKRGFIKLLVSPDTVPTFKNSPAVVGVFVSAAPAEFEDDGSSSPGGTKRAFAKGLNFHRVSDSSKHKDLLEARAIGLDFKSKTHMRGTSSGAETEVESYESEGEGEEDDDEDVLIPSKLAGISLADYFLAQRLFKGVELLPHQHHTFYGASMVKWLLDNREVDSVDSARLFAKVLFDKDLIKGPGRVKSAILANDNTQYSFHEPTFHLVISPRLERELETAHAAKENLMGKEATNTLQTLIGLQTRKLLTLLRNMKQRTIEEEAHISEVETEVRQTNEKVKKYKALLDKAIETNSRGETERTARKVQEKTKIMDDLVEQVKALRVHIDHIRVEIEGIASIGNNLGSRLVLPEVPVKLRNYRHNDVFDANLHQIEVLVSCSNIHLKKTGFSKLLQNVTDNSGKKQLNMVRVSWGLQCYGAEGTGAALAQSVLLSMESADEPRETDDSRWDDRGNESTGSPFITWIEIGQTDPMLSENPVFPSALLLQPRNMNAGDLVRFEILVKPYTSNSFEEFGAVKLPYEQVLEYARSGKKISLNIETGKPGDTAAQLHMQIFEPCFFKSSITSHYCHIGQSYQFKTHTATEEVTDVVTIREQCLEVTYTWQVPYLFLGLCETELKAILKTIPEDKPEDTRALLATLRIYQEQLIYAEEEFRGLAFCKEGPCAFKPSVERKAQFKLAITTNLHCQIMEVYDGGDYNQYETITIGCPAVHGLGFKQGGLHQQNKARMEPASKKAPAVVAARKGNSIVPSVMPIRHGKGSKVSSMELAVGEDMLEKVGEDERSGDEGDAAKERRASVASSLTGSPKPIDQVIAENPKEYVKFGWMEKKGNMLSGLQKRFFVLQAAKGELEYYKTDKATIPQGSILLKDILRVHPSHNSAEHPFAIDVTTNSRIYYINPLSYDDRESWLEKLKEVMAVKAPSPGVTTPDGPDADGAAPRRDSGRAEEGPLGDGAAEERWRSETVSKTGWIQKQHPRSLKWQKRYFKLYETVLRYFKSDTSDVAQGVVDIKEVMKVVSFAQVGTIEIYTSDRVFILMPFTEIDRGFWNYELRKAAALAHGETDFHETFMGGTSLLSQIQNGTAETSSAGMDLGGVALDLRVRLDMAMCQALSSLVTAFICRLETALLFNNQELVRMMKLGFLVSIESLLSTQGDEEAMIGDLYVAVTELFKVRFKLCLHPPARSSLDSLSMDRVDGLLEVTVYLPEKMWRQVPKYCKAPDASIKVVPLLFTQGINEMQSISNRVGSNEMQQEINQKNIVWLREYFDSYIKNHRGIKWKDGCEELAPDGIDRAFFGAHATVEESKGTKKGERMEYLQHQMKLLEDEIKFANPNEKNFKILTLSSKVVRELGGGRITCCKSGKDRTAMSCTLEQATILRDNHGVGTLGDEESPEFLLSVDQMRKHGVRRANARKNTGRPLFAFNAFQRTMLPPQYRPPASTCNKNVAS